MELICGDPKRMNAGRANRSDRGSDVTGTATPKSSAAENSSGDGPALLGVDVGGTKILGGLVSRQGQVLFEHRIPTRPLHLLEDIVAVAKVIAAQAGPGAQGIGIGTTGHVDPVNGVLTQSMNMGIAEITIAEALTEATGLAARVENDVHAATIGEIR